MRFLGMLLLLTGLYGVILEDVPAAYRRRIPGLDATSHQAAGAALLVMGAVLLLASSRRRRPGPLEDGAAIRARLAGSGFRMIDLGDGWQAEGSWRGVPVTVRKGGGYQASRYGRPWVLTIEVPGRPVEPWPFSPPHAVVLERTDHGFTVVCADLNKADRASRVDDLLDQMIAARG